MRLVALVLAAPLLGALVALSCTTSPSAFTEGELRRIEPRRDWPFVYAAMERCVEEEGDFDRVEWFEADRIVSDHGGESSGLWLIAQGKPHGIAIHRRVLEEPREFVNTVVQHEAIHEILQLGDHGHPVWCRCDARPERFDQCS